MTTRSRAPIRRLFTPRAPRNYRWVTIGTSVIVSGGGTAVSGDHINTKVDEEFADCRLVRFYGDVNCRATGGTDTNMACSYLGMLIARQDALDVGITALPDPQTDADERWAFQRGWGQPGLSMPAAQVSERNVRFSLDFKLKGKIPFGHGFVTLVKNTMGGDMEFDLHGRLLVQLR